MRCTGTVRLDAAFGAAHHGCCFGYIHILPVTHQESLALTRRQTLDFLLDDMHDLRAFDLVGAAFCHLGAGLGLQCVEQVAIVAIALVAQVRKSVTQVLRTFWRRNQSWMVFWRMRWNSGGVLRQICRRISPPA
jgi:hypothetical protein